MRSVYGFTIQAVLIGVIVDRSGGDVGAFYIHPSKDAHITNPLLIYPMTGPTMTKASIQSAVYLAKVHFDK